MGISSHPGADALQETVVSNLPARDGLIIGVPGWLRDAGQQSLDQRIDEREQSLLCQPEAADLTVNAPDAAGKTDEPITLIIAAAEFQADLSRRGLVAATTRKYELLFRQIQAFADSKGIRYLKQLDLVTLREFCATGTQGNNTALKKLERLRAFFRFAVESKWVHDNPATKIRNPKVKQTQTMPFSQEEVTNILAACDQYPDSYGRTGQWNGRRLRALVLLLRYSGLRIGDAVCLSRDRVVGNKLFLYTAKTGTPVCCPLPEFVITALDAFERKNEQYFFWSGTSEKDGAARDYMRYLASLFKLAGVPLERVSVLLGHSSVRITEKHYASWVLARQEQLEADVTRTWGKDKLALASAKGTPRYTKKWRRLTN